MGHSNPLLHTSLLFVYCLQFSKPFTHPNRLPEEPKNKLEHTVHTFNRTNITNPHRINPASCKQDRILVKIVGEVEKDLG
jgi:hypothetical protein